MRNILFSISFICLFLLSSAQYANDWIDYSKPYFKIKISDEGVYRIPASVLNSAGLNFVDEDKLVLYRDGEQVPIYIEMNGSNVSFVEFYGYGNDGKLDEQLYASPSDQMHDKYSLFSDEATYFLSFTDNVGNARLIATPNDLTNLPTPEPYFWHVSQRLFTDAYSAGERHYLGSDGLISSTFDKGEGFMGSNSDQFNNNTTTRTYSIATPHLYTAQPLSANLKTVVVGWTRYDHHFKVKIGGNDIVEHQFSDFDLIKTDDDFSSTMIGATTDVVFQAIGTVSGVNRNTPSLIEVTYPRLFEFDNATSFSFSLEGNNAKQYLELNGLDAMGEIPVLYDMTNGYRIEAADLPSATMFRFALPAAIAQRDLHVFSSASGNINTISSLQQTNFTDYSSLVNQGDYIILSHTSLIGLNEYEDYVAYRSSIAGGGYQVVEADIEELYDQFAYGIAKHPLSIRNFITFALDNWSIEPQMMFIIGKGREYHDVRTNSGAFNQCQIPTFGNPGSDILLAATNADTRPRIAIGRVVSNLPAEVGVYLEKVKEYEMELANNGDPFQTVENKIWQKEIIHLGSGNDESEQTLFKNYLNSYASLAKDTLWGANVYSVFKTSSAPIQNVQSQVLKDKIDNGVSIITFFGHSYAGGFDVNFDEPENYTNVGKYPIFLANGCYAGVIHDGTVGVSERFVLADQKGSIAFMATSELSSSTGLHTYTLNFYDNLSKENYNTTLGAVVEQTARGVLGNGSGSIFNDMVVYEMNLHGDPAIPLNQYEKPDYNIEAQNVFFEPQNITSSLDSFTINLDVYNLGKAIVDSFNVEVKRIFPDGSQEIFVSRFAAPYYSDTFSLKLPVISNQVGVGLNDFSIYIDVDDEINDEISETNNILANEVSLFVGSDDIYPIHPFEFCIVPTDDITLKASTGDVFAPMTSYVFQIDTSELFAAPLEEIVISSIGGVVEWKPTILYQNDKVYYWRVGKQNENSWQASSFIYLDGATPGWNQSHYYQYQKDKYENIYLDTDREFKFVDDVKEILVRTSTYPTIHYEQMEWRLNGIQQHNWSMNNCGGGVGYPNGLTIAVIDDATGLPVRVYNTSFTSSYGPYGNIHCVGVPDERTIANFRTVGNTPNNHPTPGVPWSDLIIDYLDNVPLGHYVLIYSINNPNYASWNLDLVSYLNSKGSSVNNGTNAPMVLAYQETGGAIIPIVNSIGNSMNDVVEETFSITGNWSEGNVRSTLIGPSLEWDYIEWDYHASESPSNDEQSVEIYGVNGVTETFLMEVTANNAFLNSIDATQYPYIRLRLKAKDEIDRTPLQLDYWRVFYSKPPEAAINPKKHFEVSRDTLNQGEIYNFSIAVENVTATNMDSLWTKYSSVYGDNSVEIEYLQDDSLKAFDTLHLSLYKPTGDPQFLGNNTILLEANPLDYNHQVEQYHFNNFASLSYEVIGDNINPLLDVTFDGVHILDGDIVSAKPEISILLKDENQYLALNDTSLFDVYIRNVNTSAIERIDFMNPAVSFYPADENNLANTNEALMIIQGNFEQDGVYELIVKSSDVSGNNSSNTDDRGQGLVPLDYKISFEVINKPSVSNVLNYPNPFTTRTQFIFTLTGSEVPEYMEIQIMNLKGNIIRQITQDELGELRIGLNKTDYWWDGRDEYGDLVANGVYFYIVKTSLNGDDIEHFSIDQVDKYFKKGVGKMVFIR